MSDVTTGYSPTRAPMAAQHNLPPQATAFIGRERQLAAVRDALLRPSTRLLTLTGSGGTGKTRLALEAVAGLVEKFAHGVFYVPLASVTDPDLVAPAIALALDVKEIAGRPVMVALGDVLRHRQALLVLDNF